MNLFGVSVSTDWRFSFLCVINGNLGHLFTSRSKFWLSNRMTRRENEDEGIIKEIIQKKCPELKTKSLG